LLRNLSAFALEMNEIACILQYSNDRALVVIDELARSDYRVRSRVITSHSSLHFIFGSLEFIQKSFT
uniref:DNA_MISMATCH_REPAIR_2 domain-containing protein n=1 Tax=Angiostrongylus cantonensis TaxID=6313 RepID=A0A0K0D447_ANGCA